MAPERPDTERASTTPDRLIGFACKLPRRRRLHFDAPTGRLDCSAVLDEGFAVARRKRWHGDLQEAVTGKIQGSLFARTESDLPEGNADKSRIIDASADQRGIAALSDLDGAAVYDAGRIARSLERPLAGHEVVIADAKRRADEAAGAHYARGRDQDAVGIDEVDLTIGVDLPGDG